MTAGERPRLLLGAAILAILAVFVALRLRVTTDITHFLPRGERDSDVDLARRIATGPMSRTMVLLVDAHDRDEAAAVSRTFEAELRAEAAVATAAESIEGGPPAGIEEALWSLWHPRRFAFLAAETDDGRTRIGDERVATAVAELKRRLASPMSGLVSRVAPSDPFLVMPRLFERMSGGSGAGLAIVEDRFVTTDGTGAVLFLTTRASSSDSTAQRPVLRGVQDAFVRVVQKHGPHLRLQRSGANRHAIAAEDSMQADMQRVSIVSLAGLLSLYLLLFRSVRPALLSLPVLGAGFLAGTASCLLAFGAIHGLTLAFGASLLGVAVDYSLHFYAHEALSPDPRGPRSTLRRIQGSLVLCTATTIVGFVALLGSTFPGLRELALFAATGLAASLGATWLILPALTRGVRVTRVSRLLTAGLAALEDRRTRARLWLVLPAIAILVATAVGLPRASWDDSVQSLNRVDATLKAEDDAVHARVARFEQRRVLVTRGADENAALANYRTVATALAVAKERAAIADFGNMAALLPSPDLQSRVDAAVRGDATLWPRLRDALAAAGFRTDAFAPFAEDLGKPAPAPLLPRDLEGTPLQALVRPFRLDLPDGTAWLSFVQRAQPDAFATDGALGPQALGEHTRVIDIEATLAGALARYRTSMVELLLLGTLAVVVLVAGRQRRLRPTLLACAPPLLAAAGTVGVLTLAGVPMNLMSLMALLMVVSMGDDYGIFLVDDADAESRDATHLSVISSAMSTIFGFGLLAMSDQPALRSIGLVSMVGVVLSVILALATGALFLPVRRGPATAH
ncbi:MAG: MMPL family transporter [Planctomycetes bacterium]|nr:MMPL family transporter [Planctomycetota bacterium]